MEQVLLTQPLLGGRVDAVAHLVVVQEGIGDDVHSRLGLALVHPANDHYLGQGVGQVQNVLQEDRAGVHLTQALALCMLVDDAQWGMPLALLVLAVVAAPEVWHRMVRLHRDSGSFLLKTVRCLAPAPNLFHMKFFLFLRDFVNCS